jgi:hypothetical protein
LDGYLWSPRVLMPYGQGGLRDKEHSSNHGFLRLWNAEVNVDVMTLLLPQVYYIDKRDYAALSNSLSCP